MATDPVTGNEKSIVEAAGQVSRGGKRLENTDLKNNSKHLKDLKKDTDGLRESVDKLAKSFGKAASASEGIQSPGASAEKSGAGTPKPRIFAQQFSSPPGGGGPPHLRSGGFGGGSFGGFRGLANQGMGPALIGANIAASTVGQLAAPLAARADRGMDYASSADKLNVLMQQMTGMSQMALMNQRKPLQNYRIGGQAGANAMVEFQSRTGIQATPQFAKSIEGIRTLTGYSKSTADILADQQALLSPQVANKMFMTLGGVNAYTSGGKTSDPMKMRMDIVKSMGLDNSFKTGGQGLGSVDRYRMTQAGIPQELQDELLQLGMAQQSWKKKGGKGDYDPSNPQHRKIMGVEENFATQQEETERVKGKREEDYMRRQIDNMADLEKSNQRLIGALGSLEDKISGLLGKQIGSRNWMKLGGAALSAVGMGAMFVPGGQAIGAGMLVGGSALGAAAGDPVDADPSMGSGGGNIKSSAANDANISIPYGYGGKRKKLSDVKSDPDFRKVDPRLQTRLLAMFRANPNVGIGDSFRDPGEQERMFKSRYRRTSSKTKIQWDGSYWEHVSGAAAAPPGRSFHEVGLASDLVGDLKWMNANAAKFGLKHFANVNSEPWHVQLAELPNSRSQWEKAGGGVPTDDPMLDGSAASSYKISPPEPDDGEGHRGAGAGMMVGGGSLSLFNGMSISDIIAGNLGQGASGGSALANRGRRRNGSGTGATLNTYSGSTDLGNLSGAELAAKLAYDAGFRGQDLVTMVAIAGRESNWNPGAANPNTSDRGLWQMNWSAHKSWLSAQGFTQQDLLDPVVNAKAARALWERSGWAPWRGSDHSSSHGGGPGFDANGSHLWRLDSKMPTAEAAVAAITGANQKSGDPMPEAGSGGGSRSSSFVSNTKNNITFSPNVQIVGSGSTPDLRRIAKEAVALMKEELELMNMRSGA